MFVVGSCTITADLIVNNTNCDLPAANYTFGTVFINNGTINIVSQTSIWISATSINITASGKINGTGMIFISIFNLSHIFSVLIT